MSEVRLSIGSRTYAVTCAEGEEVHIVKLAKLIDAKLQSLGSGRSNQDSQNLLFGALLTADELYDAKTECGTLRAELDRQRTETTTTHAEIRELREQLAGVGDQHAQLNARIAEIEKERDTLTAKIANKNDLLDRANTHMDELKAHLAGAQNDSLDGHHSVGELERVADLLENCADRLEGRT